VQRNQVKRSSVPPVLVVTLEHNFVESFVDYAIHEKAHEALRDLKMKSGNIDQFIANFQSLAH
jgi:hypothetical protein